jgi:hypothetical protein
MKKNPATRNTKFGNKKYQKSGNKKYKNLGNKITKIREHKF